MHVLGTPPAFILSQDQTLRLKGRPRGAAFKFLQRICEISVISFPSSRGLVGGRRGTTGFVWLEFSRSQYPVLKVLPRPRWGRAPLQAARRYITLRPRPGQARGAFSTVPPYIPASETLHLLLASCVFPGQIGVSESDCKTCDSWRPPVISTMPFQNGVERQDVFHCDE